MSYHLLLLVVGQLAVKCDAMEKQSEGNGRDKNLVTVNGYVEEKKSPGNGNVKNLTTIDDYGDEIQSEWNENDKDLITLLDRYGEGNGNEKNLTTLKGYGDQKQNAGKWNDKNLATLKYYGEEKKSEGNGNDKNVATVKAYGDQKENAGNGNNKNVATVKAYGEGKKSSWNGNDKNLLTLETYSYTTEEKQSGGNGNDKNATTTTTMKPYQLVKQSERMSDQSSTFQVPAEDKPNDSATLLKVLEAVKEIKTEVDDLKQKMAMETDVNTKLSSLEKSLNIIVYPLNTKNKMALKYYPNHGVQFAGFGFPENEQVKSEKVFSLESCLQLCDGHREKNGLKWNGLWYRLKDRFCTCGSKVRGFNNNAGYLFYKFN